MGASLEPKWGPEWRLKREKERVPTRLQERRNELAAGGGGEGGPSRSLQGWGSSTPRLSACDRARCAGAEVGSTAR